MAERFKGFEGRTTVTIPGRKLGACMQEILDDLNASANGMIKITSDEKLAARKLIARSSEQIIMNRACYLKLASMWSR